MHSKSALATGLIALALLAAPLPPARGAAELKVGEDGSFSAGLGLRTSYTRKDRSAPDGTSTSNNFSVENARLYLGGSWAKIFKATFNTERASDDKVRVLDAIAQLELTPEFNFWLGRMLPPSDRANLYGPFYALPWSYPGVASNYPNIAAGRDNGAMLWGKPLAGKIVYSLGAFDGHNKLAGLSGASDKLLYAGRVAFNIWDPEPAPAHYTGGWYGGSKDIFTVAVSGNWQKDGVGTAAVPGKLSIWSTDLLVERPLGVGVPTFEAAYYKYKLGALDCNSGEPGAPSCLGGGDNVGGQVDGKAWLLGGGFLFPQQFGWGKLQPFVRYQKFERTISATTSKAWDFGVNYIIRGPNAKVSLMYSKFKDNRVAAPRDDIGQLVLGLQLQY
jgi:hypothetical protein